MWYYYCMYVWFYVNLLQLSLYFMCLSWELNNGFEEVRLDSRFKCFKIFTRLAGHWKLLHQNCRGRIWPCPWIAGNQNWYPILLYCWAVWVVPRHKMAADNSSSVRYFSGCTVKWQSQKMGTPVMCWPKKVIITTCRMWLFLTVMVGFEQWWKKISTGTAKKMEFRTTPVPACIHSA